MKAKEKLFVMVIIISLLLSAMIIVAYFRIINVNEEVVSNSSKAEVEYYQHYALIVNDDTDPFWQKVEEEAKLVGSKNGICVERFGENLNAKYSVKQKMQIAIAAKVDGILVNPDASSIKSLINMATAKGIPVITMLQDEEESARVSFVGANNYELGLKYSQQIKKCFRKENPNVMVLVDKGLARQRDIYSAIVEQVGGNCKISFHEIEESTLFAADQYIRKIVIDKKYRPDILVCLSSENTISAKQAVVDYGQVGRVDIIGCFNSAEIVDGIKKGIIHSSVNIDADELGKQAVLAIKEFKEIGFVNELYTVSSSVINFTKAQQEELP